jgi:ABC-type lipoprotein release transport system permease subunit
MSFVTGLILGLIIGVLMTVKIKQIKSDASGRFCEHYE